MIDFDQAFTRVDYRLELETQPKDQKLAFLAGLEAVCAADTPKLCELRDWLKSTIEEAEPILTRSDSQSDRGTNREVVEVKKIKGVTYQHEKIRCGNPTCKCAKGSLHGPYWYAYSKKNGKLSSKYIGKNLLADVNPAA